MTTTYKEPVICQSDLVVQGALSIPDGQLTSNKIQTGANIDADKLQQRISLVCAQENIAAADETRPIFVARRACVINEVVAGSIAKAVGDSTVTIDVKKNGTTILTGVITLDSTNVNRVVEAGTLSVTTLAIGDFLEVVIDATIGTGTLPTGLYVGVEIDQNGV